MRCSWLIFGIVSAMGALECSYKDSTAYGNYSDAEILLRKATVSVCGRLPNMQERGRFYNYLKSGELEFDEVLRELAYSCDNKQLQEYYSPHSATWEDRMPDLVYGWTVDFHPAPAVCNIPVYRDIGVVLHPEVDHHPFCEYGGVCRDRMNTIFGLGQYMVGFSLDPDHWVLKRDFHELYKDDPEYHRVDMFMCSHPAANCELFELFQKPMVVFATTRLEFGRDDTHISWRVREIGKWNAWGELKERYRSWIQFIIRYSQSGLLALTANSVYDAEYITYFSGLPVTYIPSWCGDQDMSFGLKPDWTGCNMNEVVKIYAPTKNYSLIVPYKQGLWAGGPEVDEGHKMYQEFKAALTNFTLYLDTKYNESVAKYGAQMNMLKLKGGDTSSLRLPTKPVVPVVKHSNHEMRNHAVEQYKQYQALVFIPYQTSVMTFFEMYRQNIPLFAPDLDLLVKWHQEHNILDGCVYGFPDRHIDLIENVTGRPADLTIPNPNDIKNITSNYHWFRYADIYVFPHVIQFSSWGHLFELLHSTNLTAVSARMVEFNKRDRIDIARKWDEVFRKLVPNRSRKHVVEKYFRSVGGKRIVDEMEMQSRGNRTVSQRRRRKLFQ